MTKNIPISFAISDATADDLESSIRVYEENMLAHLMFGDTAKALSMVKEEYFVTEIACALFQNIMHRFTNGKSLSPDDIVMDLCGENANGTRAWMGLIDLIRICRHSNLEENIQKAKEGTIYAKLMNFSVRMVSESQDENKPKKTGYELLQDYQTELSQLSDLLENVNSGPEILKTIIHDHYEMMEYRSKYAGQMIGIPTGFRDIDKRLCGIKSTDMVLIGGRPGMGKTTFALNIATYNGFMNHPVLIFSLEMSANQLADKFISAAGKVALSSIIDGSIRERPTAGNYLDACQKLSNLPIYIDDRGTIKISDIRATALKLKALTDLKLIIVDYLQLVNQKGFSRLESISDISKGLKAIAKDLKIPIIALSQLSRQCEQRTDKRPVASDLRESGSLEQDADIIMFCYRDQVYDPDTDKPNICEILTRKFRLGEPGIDELRFIGSQSRFEDI